MIKFISMMNYTVKVISDSESVFSYLHHEIGDYFEMHDENQHRKFLIGEVNLITSKSCYKKIHDNYKSKKNKELVLHDGSYKEDLRIGKVYKYNDQKVIYSIHTSSYFIIENENKKVFVYNPNVSFGEQDIRRLIRNQIFIPYIQSMGGIVVHGAAFANQSKGTLVMGSSGSGKTSVFMAALTRSKKFKYLSCERIILFPENNKVRIYASPESVTVFPGSLVSFMQTQYLVDNVSCSEYWQRDNKLRLSWRRLFSEFNASPVKQPVYLDKIVYPKYSDKVKLKEEVIQDLDEIKALLNSNIILTGIYENRPNWLNWYQIKHDKKLKENIVRTKCSKLTWSKTDELVSYFQDK